MHTRLATPADIEFLRALHHQVYREVVTRQFGGWDEAAQDGFFERGLAEATFHVVEQEGAAIGAVALGEDARSIFIVELQILPQWQGQGLGSELLAFQLERARSMGKAVQLRVLKQNRARGLYERHGFVVTGMTEAHYTMEAAPSARADLGSSSSSTSA